MWDQYIFNFKCQKEPQKKLHGISLTSKYSKSYIVPKLLIWYAKHLVKDKFHHYFQQVC